MNNLKPYKFRDNGPLDFYDMIDGFFNNSARDVDFLKSSSFKVDIEEKDNSFIVSAEVPGYEKDEINISLDEGKLTLSLEKKKRIVKKIRILYTGKKIFKDVKNYVL